jgi:hypothetical protein
MHAGNGQLQQLSCCYLQMEDTVVETTGFSGRRSSWKVMIMGRSDGKWHS